MRIEHVLFDLDGTLTDSRLGITRCWAHVLTAFGLAVPALPMLEAQIGPPTRVVARELLGTDDPARIEHAVRLYRERYSTVGLFENEVYAGIPALLAQLVAAGYRLYVCTSKPRVYAEQIAKHFGLAAQLSGVYGPELDGTRSPKTELADYLIARERIAPAHAVLIGDRKHDIEAAHHTGMHAIGVLYGYGSAAELEAAGATTLCATVDALAPALRALG